MQYCQSIYGKLVDKPISERIDVKAIEKLAANRDYGAVRSEGVKTHSKLLHFYASRGYQRVGELIYNSDIWVDAFVFEKVLAT